MSDDYVTRLDEIRRLRAEIERLTALNADLLEALEAIVERGTDSPQHLAAEAIMAKAKATP